MLKMSIDMKKYEQKLPRYIYIDHKKLELHLSYEKVINSRESIWLWSAHYKPDDKTPGRYLSEKTLPNLKHKVWSWLAEQNIQWEE